MSDHPNGKPIPGRFFAFVEEVQIVKYHTLLIDGADEEAAKTEALRLVTTGERQVMIVEVESRTVRIKPMRERHVDPPTVCHARNGTQIRPTADGVGHHCEECSPMYPGN